MSGIASSSSSGPRGTRSRTAAVSTRNSRTRTSLGGIVSSAFPVAHAMRTGTTEVAVFPVVSSVILRTALRRPIGQAKPTSSERHARSRPVITELPRYRYGQRGEAPARGAGASGALAAVGEPGISASSPGDSAVPG
jgi:hypothetical protein